ncbi:hypothetical protein [Pseudoalteromonas maricaloris]|uniref:Uncharacterized protein n=2 Tax=Pseudoalteromonas TaxID=53246 RepID=A0A8I2H6N7_9GAMM|nr:hypothetical protein [Pseudoalteromonas maricaloris]NLR23140.1 hypothetical protein [Pseudoalteromonas maricaloris]WOX31373.1 hypothetical protein R5H13_20760 [Pseudoalteromonas maricaloris]
MLRETPAKSLLCGGFVVYGRSKWSNDRPSQKRCFSARNIMQIMERLLLDTCNTNQDGVSFTHSLNCVTEIKMNEITLEIHELGSIVGLVSNIGINATFFPDKHNFMYINGNDEIWRDADNLQQCKDIFIDDLSRLASSNPKQKNHGGARTGAGRPRTDEPKKPYRITDSEKQLIDWLRQNPLEMDRLKMKMF